MTAPHWAMLCIVMAICGSGLACSDNTPKQRVTGDCSRATGFIQLVHGEVLQGFVDGLQLALHATYPVQDAHGSARASARGRHSSASCDSAGCPVPRHWMSTAVTCRQERAALSPASGKRAS